MSETIVEITRDDGAVERYRFVANRRIHNGDWFLNPSEHGPLMTLCETNLGLDGSVFEKIEECEGDEDSQTEAKSDWTVSGAFIVGLAALMLAVFSLSYRSGEATAANENLDILNKNVAIIQRQQQDLTAAFVAIHRGEGPVKYWDGQTTRTVGW